MELGGGGRGGDRWWREGRWSLEDVKKAEIDGGGRGVDQLRKKIDEVSGGKRSMI